VDIHNLLRYFAGSRVGALAGIGREEPGVERFGETLQPTIDLWALPEAAYLRGEALATAHVTAPAVVANYGAMRLRNPAASERMVVIEEIAAQSEAGTAFAFGYLTTAGADLVAIATTSGYRDARWFIRLPTSIISYGAVAIDPAGIAPGRWHLISQNHFRTSWVLRPGDVFTLAVADANDVANLGLSWRERQRYPGEQS